MLSRTGLPNALKGKGVVDHASFYTKHSVTDNVEVNVAQIMGSLLYPPGTAARESMIDAMNAVATWSTLPCFGCSVLKMVSASHPVTVIGDADGSAECGGIHLVTKHKAILCLLSE